MNSSESKMPRSFIWLNVAQFLGALNDNIFKLLIIFYLISLQGQEMAARVTAMAGGVFVIPFLLFSAAAGDLADRISKRNILVATKVLEICIMLFGAFMFTRHDPWLAYFVLFMMSTQSAIFGPSKYGIVPELVGKARLVRANSLLVLFTYLAIIIGTALAPLFSMYSDRNFVMIALVCASFSVIGLLAGLRVEKTVAMGSRDPVSPLFFREIWRTLYGIRKDRQLIMAVIASAYFLLIGAFVQLNLIPFGIHELGLTEEQSGLLFLLAAIGIGIGAMTVNLLSGRNIEFGIVPLGALGVTLGAILLYVYSSQMFTVWGLILLLGVSSGLFTVPLDAFIQFRSPDAHRGRILAASGFLSWIGVLLAAALIYLFSEVIHLSAREGFLVIGLMTLALTVLAMRALPDFLLRFMVLIITRVCYRIRVIGAENLPVEGPALLVANHVSWMDALILNATQQRRIRFLMYREIYENRWLNPFFRLMGVIPISYQDPPKQILASLSEARAALDDGYMVCIFAEGAITRSGMLQEFKSGFERIVRKSEIPVIPVYLGGVWGSIFSYFHGKPALRRPLMLPYPVTVIYGRPLSPSTPAHQVRDKVAELSCDYFDSVKAKRRSLGEEFVAAAREYGPRVAVSDTTGRKLTYGQVLIGSLALRELLKDDVDGQEHVGLLLPPSAGGVLANMAVTLMGKVPVNMNYIASNEFRRSVIGQCGIRRVITSRKFMEKLEGMEVPEGAIYIEDLLTKITPALKFRSYIRARLWPRGWIVDRADFSPDRLATVMFSSGSTGQPKGVMLTHHNILSNVEAFRMVYRPLKDDTICAALPFFHSFGFTATLWFPLLSGMSAVYHVNPLDGGTIADLVRTHRCTLLLATPTFLLSYIRKAEPEDFSSLRAVVVGAEKLKPKIAESFEQRFGIQPLEGYGATECSPVVSVNLPPVEIDGIQHAGCKPGSVGQPLPGVAVQVVDPETYEPLPPETPGLLLVKGPNVMLGYLDMPDQTRQTIRDGWYVTGDIARIDRDGFITITDRLARFSKIGGEMVPHIALEDVYQQGLNATEQVVVVTSIPDAKKGERLIVLYKQSACDEKTLRHIMDESDLPNLWKPDRKSYFPIENIPILGSGKMDFKAVRDMAMKAAQ